MLNKAWLIVVVLVIQFFRHLESLCSEGVDFKCRVFFVKVLVLTRCQQTHLVLVKKAFHFTVNIISTTSFTFYAQPHAKNKTEDTG